VRLGGGLLVVLAAAAAGAGWRLLAGLVLAAIAAGVTAGVPEPGDALVDRVVVAVARLSEVAVYAIAFGAYVVPAHRELAAAAFVVVVAGAGFAGLKIPTIVVRITCGLLLAAGVVMGSVRLTLSPEGGGAAPRPGEGRFAPELSPGPGGPDDGERDRRWVALERRRFAVATTRATERTVVLAPPPVTPFVQDLVR